MTKALRIHAHGEPDVLRWEDIDVPPPAAGEARVRHTAIGINYSDINVRRGGFYLNHKPPFPLVLGNEAAGVVQAVGPGVTEAKPGDRVVYCGMHGEFFENTGSYAQERNVFADRLVKIPDGVSDQEAAAMMTKGFTASLIVNRMYRPKASDIILIHAAASGVGLLLTQWAKHLGATVIGTVGSQDKADLIKRHGADHAILYRDVDFVAAVKAIVPQGVSAVFDGVGKDTFIQSIACIRPFGMAVNYGNASGHVPPMNLLLLAPKSITAARPGLSSYIRDVPTMRKAAVELFDLVKRGVLKIEVNRTYPLQDGAKAHQDIESRQVAGSALLIP